MPSRNIIKDRVPESCYHVYARGVNKRNIFVEYCDYGYFIKLFERYLSKDPVIDSTNEVYPNYLNKIDILCYCLKKNHFHLLIYQHDVPSLELFMRSVMTSYSKYFNLKYKRTGPLFESRYKAVRIDSENYLMHVSRYIHLNPTGWDKYKYSSLTYYKFGDEPDWLRTNRILDLFSSRQDYFIFVSDYEEMKNSLSSIKHQLADK